MMKFIMPRFLLNIERWKWNDEYRVYVSTLGHFKDEYKKDLPIKVGNGYCHIKTNRGIKLAHRIVMLTWRPIPDAENLTVDHLDHNKRHNALSNLEWVTREENVLRANRDMIYVSTASEEKHPITDGERIFETAEIAAETLLKESNMLHIPASNVAIKINKAIKNNKPYFGRTWAYAIFKKEEE